MEFKSSIFAVLIFSMIIIAAGVFVGDWNNHYNSGLSYDLGEFDKLSDVSGQAELQQGRVSPQTAEVSTDFEASTFRGAFGILSNIYTPFRVVFGDGGMIDSVTERFGLPDYVRQTLVIMLIVAISFAIIAVVFRIPGGTT